MATLSVEFYLFGCPDCGHIVSQDAKRAPVCHDGECPRLGESLISWHELMARIDGEGWKYS